MSIRAASPRPPFRSAMICLALASCSGGGSMPATAPVIQNLVVTPAAVYVSPTPMTFTAQFQFEDPNGDLASAELVLRDDTGGVVATQTTPIQQAAGVTAAQLIGSATATLVTPGSFTAHLSLTDRTGLVSNELTAGVEVRLFPWSTEASLPVAVRRPAAAVLGDLVYAIGGERTDLTSVGPASGAANAAIAAFLDEATALHELGSNYRVSQGREIGRDATLLLRIDDDRDVWVGGECRTVIEGRFGWQ